MLFSIGLLCILGFIITITGYVIGEKSIKNRDFDILIFGIVFILFGLGVILGSVIYWCGGT